MPYDKSGGRFHPDFLRNGSPSTILRETFPPLIPYAVVT